MIEFSLRCEMGFTNILTMLDLSRLPLRSADHAEKDPLIIGGGSLALNTVPIALFFDPRRPAQAPFPVRRCILMDVDRYPYPFPRKVVV
ncbi:MAG TPA: hypothetical protein VFG08_07265, partial [Candidatus Polarisedimenticolia bacterium]|nr:hypothetical protein [Candidatus Polarisedimenticolia bacterium]